MPETYTVNERKKIARSLVRLQKSIEADRSIAVLLEDMERMGTEGITPQLEVTLDELLGKDKK